MDSPFHEGELLAQQLAGQGSSGGAIRDYMPDQHREFFAMLPMALLADVAADGWPRAGVLTGAPGFIASPDPQTLRISASADLALGANVGLLGLDFSTRRRNRANGFVATSGADGFTLAIEQSFGNCPRYIHLRDVSAGLEQGGKTAGRLHRPALDQAGLDDAARGMIAYADTFFVATTAGTHGADISHRGGPRGFVHIAGDTLTVPDFSGNRYYNTLGNMLMDERAALLFIDYASGDLLHLQGRTEVLWDDAASSVELAAEFAGFPGAERLWRFHVERSGLQRGALALRWTERDAAG